MNNNRNNNNRRRGRGNRNNQGGNGNQLNRIDSRARGNAPQLLDKYKKLAQDAQHNGDRVQAEYFLQFADHYFRVIADNKARQDEARAKRNEGRESSGDENADDEDGGNRRNEGRNEGRRGNNRRSRGRRDDQADGDFNDAAGDTSLDGGPAEGQSGVEGEVAHPEEAPKPKRRARKPKTEEADAASSDEASTPRRKPRASRAKPKDKGDGAGEIDSSVLPPAIGGDDPIEAVS